MPDAHRGHLALRCQGLSRTGCRHLSARLAQHDRLRQRHGTDLNGGAALVPADRRGKALHRPRQAHEERLCRKLQRSLPRRVPRRHTVLDARRSPQRHHLMEGELQQSPTTLGARQHAPGRVRNEIHTRKAVSSSVWAKYAEALRRISLASRSSRFSRSSAFSCSATSGGTPPRLRPSTSARLTHYSRVWVEQPILAAI